MRRSRFVELPEVFRGSAAVADGLLTPGELRGPLVRRLFTDVYAPRAAKVTHSLYCKGAALILPSGAVVTGRSAAALRSVRLVGPSDPVEVIAPTEKRVTRRAGISLRRTEIEPGDWEEWRGIGLADPYRMAFDLLLDRPLPQAVGDLDAVLRAGLVDADKLAAVLEGRHDRGIVQARQAVALSDPRAESLPESEIRVLMALDGLFPTPQYWITNEFGRLACVDFAFEEQKVAIEYDGQWKSGNQWCLNYDRTRLNMVYAEEWEVVFVTNELRRRPPTMLATIRAALDRR